MDKIKKWQNHIGPILDFKNGFDVIECETCGFKHIVPIPTQKELGNYYKTEFVEKRPKLINKIKADLEWWEITYSEKYDFFEKYFPDQNQRLLDVGCGLGYFLKKGKNRGWDVLGIEPSEQSVKHACRLDLNVLNATVYDKEVKHLDRFNVINMHEVLEHLPDPVGALKICYDLLIPGGLLCLTVPNDYNILQEMLRDTMGFKPWWIAPPPSILTILILHPFNNWQKPQDLRYY